MFGSKFVNDREERRFISYGHTYKPGTWEPGREIPEIKQAEIKTNNRVV